MLIKPKVEIWTEVLKGQNIFAARALGASTRHVVRTLQKGETVKAFVALATEISGDAVKDAFFGGGAKTRRILNVTIFDENPEKTIFGQVLASEVRVTCVPREVDFIRDFFPELPVIDWDPE